MRLSIGKKLNFFLVAILLTSILALGFLATHLFTSDLAGLLRKDTLDVSSIVAGRVRSELRLVAERTLLLSSLLQEASLPENARHPLIERKLRADKDVLAVTYFRDAGAGFQPYWQALNPELAQAKNFSIQELSDLGKGTPLLFDRIAKGNVEFTVVDHSSGQKILRLGLPFVQKAQGVFSELLVAELRGDMLTALFAESTSYLSYVTTRSALVLGSSDPARLAAGTNVSGFRIYSEFHRSDRQDGQIDFENSSGESQIGAFQRVGFADLGVITQVPLARAQAAHEKLFRRAGALSTMILFLALAFGFAFSRSISRPIAALAEAARRVKDGDFSFQVVKPGQALNPRGDEVHHLSHIFDGMVQGLRERDKAKTALSIYHSKDLVERVMSGELKIGGERRLATVLFADIRGFTTMGERMDPEVLVRVLNQFLACMVSEIHRHGGFIDKFMGDGVLAAWGVSSPAPDDADRAIHCCLAIRGAMEVLNLELRRQGFPNLYIGMGLNHGPVIVGNIGSRERMEYTMIGDTVNTATRIETLTKLIGVDLLVSDSVLRNCAGMYSLQDSKGHFVKGRAQSVRVFQVERAIDEATPTHGIHLAGSGDLPQHPGAVPQSEELPDDVDALLLSQASEKIKRRTG